MARFRTDKVLTLRSFYNLPIPKCFKTVKQKKKKKAHSVAQIQSFEKKTFLTHCDAENLMESKQVSRLRKPTEKQQRRTVEVLW